MDVLILYAVHHAHSREDELDIMAGQTDVGLSGIGEVQLAAVSSWFRHVPIHHAFSSDLVRATRTCDAIVCAHPRLERFETSGALRGRCCGDFDGMRREKVPWDRIASEEPLPSGEAWDDVRARLRAFFRQIASACPDPVLVVTHAGVIRVMLGFATGMDIRKLHAEVPVGNTSVWRFDWYPGDDEWVCSVRNHLEHLEHLGLAEPR